MEHPDVVKLENKLNKVWDDRDIEAQRQELKKYLVLTMMTMHELRHIV